MHRGVGLIVALVALAGSAQAQSPAGAFVNFESGHVRPLALSPDGSRLFAVNTPDNRLAIYTVGAGSLTLEAEVQVGLDPVAVAARTNTEVWVVNHLSDSISIVTVDTATPALSRVSRTLHTCDEPRDIVFAGPGGNRAFVATARRGQNCPVAANLTAEGIDRAIVQVWDATSLGAALGGTPIANVTLFGDTPRALARSSDGSTVYAAVFLSGNRTTAITQTLVSAGAGLPTPPPGSTPGAPPTGLVVKFDGSTWKDERPASNWNGQVAFSLPDRDVFLIDANASPPALAPNPNNVVGVGTTIFNMAVRPSNGRLFVSNLEARNHVRFEPFIDATHGVQGNIAPSRITVVNGTTPTPRNLNPQIDYTCHPPGCTPSNAVREASLAFPLDMAFSSDGSRLYVAGFGSEKVGIFDATALEAGTITLGSTKFLVEVGDGPSGVALDEARDQLYVMNRIEHTISIVGNVDTPASAAEVGIVPLRYDPSPAIARVGRTHLYNARNTSSNGEQACASCHIFGGMDGLAWDLGDPFGVVDDNDNPFRLTPGNNISGGGDGVGIPCTNCEFHPMKGPMTTQTLRGMAGMGPMHWRGDRTGVSAGGSALDEDLAFKAFNPAFVGLLGRTAQLTTGEMQDYANFILTVALPPNPIRNLDNSLLANQSSGQTTFTGTATDGGALTCVFCHRLPAGTDGLSTFEGEPQEFKIAHMRNLYDKVGMFGVPNNVPGIPATGNLGEQVRGFGFLHDGSVATVFAFVNSDVFANLNNTSRQNLEAFSHVVDTGLRPIVGQQVGVTPATVNDANVITRINLMIARDDAGDCELVVKGNSAGEARGWVYTSGNQFRSDRHSEALIGATALRGLAGTAGQEQMWTCVPPFTGTRIGVDRDRDGFFDRRELDCASNPADPTSTPGSQTGACGPVTTTTTSSTTSTSIPGATTTTTSTSTTTSTTIAGDPTTPIQSTSMSLKDDSTPPANPAVRQFKFKANTRFDAPAFRVVAPAQGSGGDPRTAGATLVVYNANGSGESASATMPAAGWSALGTTGYRYRAQGTSDPVRSVKVKADQIRITVKGATWGYTLNEAQQVRMAVRLQLGSALPWCASTLAKTSGNPPTTASYDLVDKFVGQPGTPTLTCPSVP